MGNTFFVTGTDTGAGKTLVTAGLLAAAAWAGKRTMGLKPVAAGCEQTSEGLRNEDALILQEAASIKLPYQQVNPVALAPAIAPHIAAERAGRGLTVSRLVGFCRGAMLHKADLTLIEGAGGWRVPLNNRETMADIAKALELPVILVVSMKLGCLNQALLTAEAVKRDGLWLAGWVANTLQPIMNEYQANLDYLAKHLESPLIGEVPLLSEPTANEAAKYLKPDLLLKSAV